MNAEALNVDHLAERLLGRPVGALRDEELRVLTAIVEHEVTARDAMEMAEQDDGFGARLSDRVAAVGGSWGFIIAFGAVLFAWMLLNSQILGRWGLAFDPYPFIFLNLMLSTLAAIQAPIIMMSQNRQAAKDRVAAAHDYEVNLRAELDIRRLHHKIDQLAASLRESRST